MPSRLHRGLAAAVVAVLALVLPAASAVAVPTHGPGARAVTDQPREPLAGRVVVLDAGHQLGNARFPRQTSRLVPAGGFRKPCNTTGTATNGGVPEATIVWQVTRQLQRRLERMGARVVLTRTSNGARRWGPCVDVRGRAGNRLPSGRPADLKLSIHADGSYARGARGFHVIVPPARRPWTHDIARPSVRLARDVRAALRGSGLRPATYVAGGTGIDVRSDLATLNLSDVPTALVELGNLRDRGDARRLTSRPGQARHAAALARAVRLHLR